jgi:peptidoglycan/LPS O-acetylase OafA/YrhL
MSEQVAKGIETPAARSFRSSWWRSRGRLDKVLSGRNNSFGLLRLLLASSVVYAHAYPIGYNLEDPLWKITGGQTDVGKLAVVGFFVLSGFMITSSGRRLQIGRYAWHRCLRIFPGLWMCLVVTAFVVAPIMFLHQHGDLNGFWNNSDGPVQYVHGMYNTSISTGWDISGVMKTADHRGTNFNNSFDGALWSLKYELFCYIVVGILAAGGALKRAPRTVLLITTGLWATMLMNALNSRSLRGGSGEPSTYIEMPFIGNLDTHYIIYLGFAFMLGASFQLYRHRFPVNDALGVLSAVVLLGTFHFGLFNIIGYPAFAYLLMWLGVRLPSWLHWIGRKHDYSYGVYIYGFVVEQFLCLYGVNHWGVHRYFAVSLAATLTVAVLSWHLVESQAMKLKDMRSPVDRWRARRAVPATVAPAEDGPVADESVYSGNRA